MQINKAQRYYWLQFILFRLEKQQFAQVNDMNNEYFSTFHTILHEQEFSLILI